MAENDYQYLMPGDRLTNYSAIPNTVCEMDVSSTAKIIYARLLNRAQLSANNDFVDADGRTYVIYTIEELSRELRMCSSTIKDNLRELSKVGLIEKCSSQQKNKSCVRFLLTTANTVLNVKGFVYIPLFEIKTCFYRNIFCLFVLFRSLDVLKHFCIFYIAI